MSLRLLEHYTSVQGEGPHVGELTQFVRFAGCNMRCPLWPCDTPQAIFPENYRNTSEMIQPEDLAHRIMLMRDHGGAQNVCFTGGEPLLQNNQQLFEAWSRSRDGFTWEVFTNGSFKFPPWVLHHFDVMMDWKLHGSGEAATKRDVRLDNAKRLKSNSGVKFVVTDLDDLYEAEHVTRLLRSSDCHAQLWVTPAWDRMHPTDVIEYMKKHTEARSWRLSLQVHKYIWDPTETGV